MSVRVDVRQLRAQVVRAQGFGVDAKIRVYPKAAQQAYLETARGLKLDALAYLPELDRGARGVVWPDLAQKLLAWAHAWLDAGAWAHAVDRGLTHDGGVPIPVRAQGWLHELRSDDRWVELQRSAVRVPQGPPEEWEDACERELVGP